MLYLCINKRNQINHIKKKKMKIPNNEKRALTIGAICWVVLLSYFTFQML